MQKMRTITVRGVGNATARPDYITISMTIESVRREYDEAMKDTSERIAKLQEVTVRLGYAKEELKTTAFNVDTRYESTKDRHGNYKREFVGYACVYRLKLSFDFDSKQLAKAISCIADSGTNPELNIAFTVRNPAKISEELLESAALNARTTAEILCSASGNEIGQLLSIDYNWGELNIVSRTSYEMEEGLLPLAALDKCSTPEIEPDDIKVSDTVSFTWEIR